MKARLKGLIGNTVSGIPKDHRLAQSGFVNVKSEINLCASY